MANNWAIGLAMLLLVGLASAGDTASDTFGATLEYESDCPDGESGVGTFANPCEIVDCDTQLGSSNLYYELTADIIGVVGTCFDNVGDGITLFGRGHSIEGDGVGSDSAIELISLQDVNLTNFTVEAFESGIYLSDSSYNTISNVTLNNNSLGIYIEGYSGNYNTLTDIITNSNGFGVQARQGGYNTIERLTSTNDDTGCIFDYGDGYNNLTDSTITSPTDWGIYISDSTDFNIIDSVVITNSGGIGIVFVTGFSDNTILNCNITGSATYAIYENDDGSNDYVIYNNTQGQIYWRSTNLTTVGDMTFPGTIKIGHGYAYVNSTALNGIDDLDATITLYNTPGAGFYQPAILRDGVVCDDTTTPICTALTALTDATVEFEVEYFSNYSIGEGDTPPVIDWNWSEINSTITASNTLVCVNTSETANCTLYVDGLDFVNDTPGTDICWDVTGIGSGNHTGIYATCEDILGMPADSSLAWVYRQANGSTGGGGAGDINLIDYVLTPDVLTPTNDYRGLGIAKLRFNVDNKLKGFQGEVLFEVMKPSEVGDGAESTTGWCVLADSVYQKYNYPGWQMTNDIPISCEIPLMALTKDVIFEEKVCVRMIGSLKKECSLIQIPLTVTPLEAGFTGAGVGGFLKENWMWALGGVMVLVIIYFGKRRK